jgi:uncharacterized protein (DUF2147 family)
MKILTCFTVLLLTATTAFGAGSNVILGIWNTEMGESKVEVFHCGEKICGKIIWLKNPNYTDSRDGAVGTPVIDRKNPDPALKSRPVLGLRIMEGFTEQGANNWGNGTCYDPKSGNTYRGKIHLAAPGRLELRGYIGIPLFGRTSVWTR